jgi:hypothetical protein
MTAPVVSTTIRTLTAALTDNSDGMTTSDLAHATGLTVPTISKALTEMQTDGSARREAGPKGRKSADLWFPATPATEAPDGDSTPADEVTSAAPADDNTPATETPETPADTASASETGDTTPAPVDEATSPEAPVSAPPVAPRKPDLKVMIMAGVLGEHPDGITADAAIDESGLASAVGEVILAAMEVAGVACRKPITADGTELWVPGENTDLATVDPANAPTSIACPTCGHERKIRRVAALRRTTPGGPARVTAEINKDGGPKLGSGELRRMVEAFHRDLGPGHELTPGTIAKELGRSPGAIVNNQRALYKNGVLALIRNAPETYALADNAPAPTADVLALMAPPATTPADDTTAATDDTTGNTADDTAGGDVASDTTGTDVTDAPTADDAA